jgi:hypothetical protein
MSNNVQPICNTAIYRMSIGFLGKVTNGFDRFKRKW